MARVKCLICQCQVYEKNPPVIQNQKCDKYYRNKITRSLTTAVLTSFVLTVSNLARIVFYLPSQRNELKKHRVGVFANIRVVIQLWLYTN
jgi:hypothetical protein